MSKVRPSPSESATLLSPGSESMGNDGKVWIVVLDKNGINRWKKN